MGAYDGMTEVITVKYTYKTSIYPTLGTSSLDLPSTVDDGSVSSSPISHIATISSASFTDSIVAPPTALAVGATPPAVVPGAASSTAVATHARSSEDACNVATPSAPGSDGVKSSTPASAVVDSSGPRSSIYAAATATVPTDGARTESATFTSLSSQTRVGYIQQPSAAASSSAAPSLFTATPLDPNYTPPQNTSLSPGAIAGVVIGAICAFALFILAAAIFIFLGRRRKQLREMVEAQQGAVHTQGLGGSIQPVSLQQSHLLFCSIVALSSDVLWDSVTL